MSYNCPGCDKIMAEEPCTGLPPNYRCVSCDIGYYELIPADIINSEFYVGGEVLCRGTFEYCCRIYKLKCFT